LERLVFGGESDVIEALKDNKTTEQEDFFKRRGFYFILILFLPIGSTDFG